MKRVAITMGEPGGIGPEVAIKGTAEALKHEKFEPVFVGDPDVFDEAMRTSGIRLDEAEFKHTGSAYGYKKGEPTATGGIASSESIRRGAALALSRDVDALVTAPISKEALGMARLRWPGHTEMLAEITNAENYAMMLMSGTLRVMLVTIHVPLKKVPSLITRESVLRTIRLASDAARMLSIKDPRIAVCGLNPHAGEASMFGDEEEKHIRPAVGDAAAEGISVTGPYPADTVFHRAINKEFDIVVSMYHDQGLAPLKAVGFETGINITVGLPIIRTSPDHGTAYEIAWQNKANPLSMELAIRAALRLKPATPREWRP